MPWLLLEEPHGPPRQFDLSAMSLVFVGRERGNTLTLPDPRVSRRHFLIEERDGRHILTNLSKTQVTLVNGAPVASVELREGDRIAVGDTQLTFSGAPRDSHPVPPSVPPSLRLFSPTGEKQDRLTTPLNLDKTVYFTPETSSDALQPLATSNPKENRFEAVALGRRPPSSVQTDQHLAERLRLLQEIGREMVCQLDLDRLLEYLLDKIFTVLAVDNGLILLANPADPEKLEPRAVRLCHKSADKGERLHVSQTLLRRVLKERIGFLCADTQTDVMLQAQQSIVAFGMRSVLCVPLLLQNEVLGIIHVDSETQRAIFSSDDLDLLTALANQAALCVSNARLHDRIVREATLRANLERFFSPAIAHKIACNEIDLEPSSVEAVILYSDIRNFTRICEEFNPVEVLRCLNDYFSAMTDLVFEFGGHCDKFIGDALVAVFGSPLPDANAPLNAARCAEKMIHRLREMHFSIGDMAIGIGLHCGKVIHGQIGSDERLLQYTVLGDTVNTTARLSDVAGPNQIVLSPQMLLALGEAVETQALGRVRLKGKRQPMETFELVRCK
ncbi:MAG TPA: adenylate/guanylate cyclase domain-containing protein [Candidatus Sumerlaeota bacterium]|nr:adenylate/guanylate cyclase domain-containing protein [Candidatus Sumerlaeota bacterium]